MQIQGQLQWTDYLKASLLHMRPRFAMQLFLYGLLFTAIGVIVVSVIMFFTNQDFFQRSLSVPFLLLFILFCRYILLPRRVKYLFQQQKSLHLPFTLTISEKGLIWTNENGQGLMPWNYFVKYKEGKELFLLYHSDVLFQIVMKRFLSLEQEKMLRGFLEHHQVKKI